MHRPSFEPHCVQPRTPPYDDTITAFAQTERHGGHSLAQDSTLRPDTLATIQVGLARTPTSRGLSTHIHLCMPCMMFARVAMPSAAPLPSIGPMSMKIQFGTFRTRTMTHCSLMCTLESRLTTVRSGREYKYADICPAAVGPPSVSKRCRTVHT